MKHRIIYSVILLVCFSFILFYAGIINLPFLEQKNTKEKEHISEQKNTKEKQQAAPDKIYGKVTDIIDVTGYTYAEVDTGKEKIWAAGPVTQLNRGDLIGFTTGMPMKNFHSKAMERDFPIIYFVGRFITDEEAPTTKAEAIATPHSQIKQVQVAKPVKEIDKVEGGNTIAEIYAQKQNLKGETIRVRGQVTKFTAEIMGKNWLHIMDSSTLEDLTATTGSTVAIGDIVIIEGNLELDKNYGYGYVYSVIVEDAKITKE
jgi:hypothetical protein